MLGIIGGTGLYAIDGIENVTSKSVETPFGVPSAEITLGEFSGKKVAFLPRHGPGHKLLPGEINFRANIWALKAVGVREIVSISAVGSLRMEIEPGDLAIPAQYLDWIKGPRQKTFFGNGVVAHVSTAHPSCPKLTASILEVAQGAGTRVHSGKTYACVDGPRLGTKAESDFLRRNECDLVGMTNVPEVFLAREAQMCYCTIAVATDYDCWLDDPAQHATVDKVIALYKKNITRVQTLLKDLIVKRKETTACGCREALKYAVLTDEKTFTPEQRQLISFLKV